MGVYVMKRALISSLEIGRICDIVAVGEEFEISNDFSWIDCPDEITTQDTYNPDTAEFKVFDILSMPGFAENAYKIARSIAYTSVGNQLDMLYKELQANGTISLDGPWAQHIATVKDTIPKDDPAAVLAWNQAQVDLMNNQP